MPSPFPGMDPYLEAPGLWPDVHHAFMSVAREFLNRSLRPQYHVRLEERVYISDENDPGRRAIIPDLKIVHTGEPDRDSSSPAIAAVAIVEPIVMTTLIEDEIHEARLEIVDTAQRSVVTVMELLSPANKIAGSRGRASYEEKRREVMTSSSHFVEIDLLRGGDHLHTRELLPVAEYYVHISRRGQRPKGCVWPIRLHQTLPVIGIPLKDDDEDAKLDLQLVLKTAYDRAAYDLVVDYSKKPVPPLEEPWNEWAKALLEAGGVP